MRLAGILESLIDDEAILGTFFEEYEPSPNAHLIKDVVYGYRVEELEDPFFSTTRHLDKLIDELARSASTSVDNDSICRGREVRTILPCNR